MSSLNKRGKAVEDKFFHDEKLNFKVISRRRRLLGLWAAELMHYDENKTLQYAVDIVNYAIDNAEKSTAISRVLKDFKEAGLSFTQDQIQDKVDELHRDATLQIQKEYDVE